MAKFMREMNFSADSTANDIIRLNAELAGASAYEHYPNTIERIVLNNYKEQNEKVKEAILKFASDKAGIDMPKTKDEMMFARDNAIFINVLNSITTQTISYMMQNYENPQLQQLASVENVEVGSSKTYEIDTKALPTVQRGNYTQNVTLVPSYAKSAITLTPKVYSAGVSLDYVRIIANGYDWGNAVAKIYASFIYAQYKLVTSLVFNDTILAGTPLYSSSFSQPTYLQLAEDIAMLNGGSSSNEVVALGTRTALGTLSGSAVTGGSSIKDEYVTNGYIQQVAGVPSIVLDNFTNLNVQFNTANASSLRALPNNLVVLVSRANDKIVKLIRETYIRAEEVEASTNTLNRMEYIYNVAFDAKIATSSFFGVQKLGE